MLDLIANGIDRFNTKMGELTSLLVIPLLLVVVFEVFMRYALNAPTVWAFEMTTFLYGVHYMFGLAYTDVNKGHVKVDIFTSRAPRKVQAIINIFSTVVMSMPVFICLTIWTGSFAYTSVIEGERNSSSWAPIIYPLKVIMAVTFFFVLLQAVSNLFREIKVLANELKSEKEEG